MGTAQKELAHGIPLFRGNGSEFQNWSYRVKLYLEAAGVSEVLTGVAPAAAAERAKFIELDRKGKALLVSCISDDCLEVVREKTTTKEMWESLQATYAKKSVASQTLIRKQLARLRMKEGSDMRGHLVEFDSLVRKLKTAGATLAEGDLVSQLFLTLPDSFDPLVTALENVSEDDLTLDLVKQRLLAEESKRTDRQETSEENPAAFSGSSQKQFSGKCHKCGIRGHMAKDCHSNGPNNGRGNKRSTGNGRGNGHGNQRSNGHNNQRGNGEANCVKRSAVTFMADAANVKHEVVPNRVVFKLDSGCSDHLVSEKSLFSFFQALVNPIEIKVAKEGQAMIARTIGTIDATSNKGVLFHMKDVLLVPDLRENLMSVKKLTAAGIEVVFSGQTTLLKRDGELLATGRMIGSLYEIVLTLDKACANVCDADPSKLWHRRLGHISQHGMDIMIREGMLSGIKKSTPVGFCEVCVQGKHCRDPFSGTRNRASRPLERIHSDVCGPIDPPAWDGSRYIVSFIDDYSHFAMIYLLKKKSGVFQVFREYEATVTAAFGLSISKMTVDQGREYCSNAQQQFYKQKGIQLEVTVAYTPQQNGVAERFNRTLEEKIRAVLIESGVPKKLWSEAALACVYLLNRSPTVALPAGVSPAERWYGSKPNLDKLRVFGCRCFAWVPSQQRKKLDPKSREMIMIGYAPNGYRLWDMQAQKVKTARDVKFDESSFPYAKLKPSDDVVPLVVNFPFEQEGETAENEVVPDIPDDEASSSGDEEEPGCLTDDEDQYEDPVAEPVNALPPQIERHGIHDESVSRRSGRERRLPGKLFDFFVNYRATSGGLISSDLPMCYNDIMRRDDQRRWLGAVQDELESMAANNVWRFVKCPDGVKPLKAKWVFRIKDDADGNAVRYKARLVARGFLQKAGLDYEETFAPVAKLATIRTVFAAGVKQGFLFHNLDVKTAFLYGELKQDIYMEVPDGVEAPPNTVCRLLKSLYGLKQSPRCWNEKLNEKLLNLGFERSRHDYCLYTRIQDEDEIYLILYVDDLLICGRNLKSIMKLKKQLTATFAMTDCGAVTQFLGIRVDYDVGQGRMRLSQAANVDKLLVRFEMVDCNPVKCPMEKGIQLAREGEPTTQPYRELLGSLMYLMLCTRPDICYPVGFLGRFQQKPTAQHWQCLKRVVRYIKGTKAKCLEYRQIEAAETLVGYVDADWASDTEDRKSVSGFAFFVFGNLVSWSSKKQNTVATSSSEAEYIALSSAVSEAIWLSGILEDLKLKTREPVTIYEDNQGCIGMAKNCESKRSKHIDVRHHFIREHISNGSVKVEYLRTEDQLADLFTKPMEAGRLDKLGKHLGIAD